jgi:predicted AlkP superfamily pyrophosphatase or phosphodiesterase
MRRELIVLLSFLCCFGFAAHAQNDSLEKIIPGRRNSPEQMKKPYVIIISADGFRYDYAEKYQAKHLLKLAASGIQAESMIPSFPSVTHPNHFALMSGLYPAHSGIVGNDFYDPARKAVFKSNDGSWFGEEPIWVTAEKQNLLTACFYWVDGTSSLKGIRPTYYYKPNKNKEVYIADRVAAVKNWLNMPEDQRPHFISFYFPEADHQGHNKGTDAPETRKAVEYIDNEVGKLAEAAKASGLPVNFIFVSDHGMTNIDQNALTVPALVDREKFVITSLGATVNLQAKDLADVMPTYEKLKAGHPFGYDVYLKKDVPAELHYSAKEDKYNRIGDIVLLAQWPKSFNNQHVVGAHGYNPYKVKDMHATFFAWGPAFRQHLQIPAFQNVEVYDLMADILGITPLPNDGTGALAKEILK